MDLMNEAFFGLLVLTTLGLFFIWERPELTLLIVILGGLGMAVLYANWATP